MKIKLTGDLLEFNGKKVHVGFYSLTHDALEWAINHITELEKKLEKNKMNEKEVEEIVCGIISEYAPRFSSVKPDDTVYSLDVDPLDQVDIIVSVEERFNVDFGDAYYEFGTVQDLIDKVVLEIDRRP